MSFFATTALVAFAGAAAAEVAVSGDARMGVHYLEGRTAGSPPAAAEEWIFENRVRIKFTASGTTDGGLDWEVSSGFNTGSNLADNGNNAFRELGVTISGAFGALTFGSESSAAEYAVGDLAGTSFGPGPNNNETAYITGARALYSYSAGTFTFYASTEEPGTEEWSVGGKYSANGLTIGIGYEDTPTDDHTVGSIAYAMGNTTVKAVYGVADVALESQMGVSVSHKMGAATLKGFYRVVDDGTAEADNYGIGVDYALGGGATLAGGVSSNDGATSANLGMKFSF